MATESPYDGPGMFYVGGIDREVEDRYQRPGGTYDRAEAAKDHLKYVLREFDQVNGIGLCKTGTGWALKVLLTSAITEGITPSTVNGVPVVYDIVGEITPLAT